MAVSNGKTPTVLDEAVRTFAGYVRGENGFDELDFKEWLIEWHNKQVEAVLDSLEKQAKSLIRNPDGSSIGAEYIPLSAIEAERNKLKNT